MWMWVIPAILFLTACSSGTSTLSDQGDLESADKGQTTTAITSQPSTTSLAETVQSIDEMPEGASNAVDEAVAWVIEPGGMESLSVGRLANVDGCVGFWFDEIGTFQPIVFQVDSSSERPVVSDDGSSLRVWSQELPLGGTVTLSGGRAAVRTDENHNVPELCQRHLAKDEGFAWYAWSVVGPDS